jgi:hypothetical protein
MASNSEADSKLESTPGSDRSKNKQHQQKARPRFNSKGQVLCDDVPCLPAVLPEPNQGQWDVEEERRFEVGMKKFPPSTANRWVNIRRFVLTRTGQQIASHARNMKNSERRDLNVHNSTALEAFEAFEARWAKPKVTSHKRVRHLQKSVEPKSKRQKRAKHLPGPVELRSERSIYPPSLVMASNSTDDLELECTLGSDRSKNKQHQQKARPRFKSKGQVLCDDVPCLPDVLPKPHQGQWDVEEGRRFEVGMRRFPPSTPNRWVNIRRFVLTRTGKQIASHARSMKDSERRDLNVYNPIALEAFEARWVKPKVTSHKRVRHLQKSVEPKSKRQKRAKHLPGPVELRSERSIYLPSLVMASHSTDDLELECTLGSDRSKNKQHQQKARPRLRSKGQVLCDDVPYLPDVLPKPNKGQWDVEEERRFEVGMRRFPPSTPNRWVNIRRFVLTRTGQQIAAHAQSMKACELSHLKVHDDPEAFEARWGKQESFLKRVGHLQKSVELRSKRPIYPLSLQYSNVSYSVNLPPHRGGVQYFSGGHSVPPQYWPQPQCNNVSYSMNPSPHQSGVHYFSGGHSAPPQYWPQPQCNNVSYSMNPPLHRGGVHYFSGGHSVPPRSWPQPPLQQITSNIRANVTRPSQASVAASNIGRRSTSTLKGNLEGSTFTRLFKLPSKQPKQPNSANNAPQARECVTQKTPLSYATTQTHFRENKSSTCSKSPSSEVLTNNGRMSPVK